VFGEGNRLANQAGGGSRGGYDRQGPAAPRRHSADTLERSVDLCERVFTDVQDYAREKRLPIGINVESVSIRRSEIDASVELYRRLSSRLDG